MMPEILTESFCERCGTRYTFESAAPRKTRRLGQIKTLSKGMKNWVMSDDTSLDEAMAAARNDEDRELTSQQLDAFHATFNFCMSCRQYTCGNCWNAAEGRCLSCAPHLGQEILPAAFPDQAAFEPVRIEADAWPDADVAAAASNGNGHHADHALHEGDSGWASVGAMEVDAPPEFDAAARLAFLSGEEPLAPIVPEPEPWVAAETETGETPAPLKEKVAAARAQPDEPVVAEEAPLEAAAAVQSVFAEVVKPVVEPVEPSVAAATEAPPEATIEPLPPTPEGKAEVGAARTSNLLRRFRPGQNIDAELAAYEASLEPAAGESQPAPGPAAAPAPEPIAAEPEPIAAAAAEPEPIAAAAAELEPATESVPEPVAAQPAPAEPTAADAPKAPAPAELPTLAWPIPTAPASPPPAPRDDRIQQPTWQIFAPEAAPPVGQPADTGLPRPIVPPSAPPAEPQWPVSAAEIESPAMALLANRANRSSSDALWAASAREVLARPPIVAAAGPTAGVQPCSSCGLSLSATARFCRRCGTRQA
jgi:hypothetical protein